MPYTVEEKKLCEKVALIKSVEEYIVWEQQCDELIETLREQARIKRPRLSIGHQQLVIAQILRLEGLKHATRQRFVHTGAGSNDHGLIWREIDTAFKNRVSTGAVINQNHIEPRQFLLDASKIVLNQVQNSIDKYNSVKVNTMFNGEFAAGDRRENKSINTPNVELFSTADLGEWYEHRVIEPTLASLDEFQERDSGWALSRILNLTVNINKYNPLRAGCHIELPRKIMLQRAVVNVKSRDNACFAWAVIAALYPAERNSFHTSSYPHYSTVLNLHGIDFPMTLNQIKKFEQQNNISVNVYSMETKEIVPIRVSKQKLNQHVNLLYVQDQADIGHFACIQNLSRLISAQTSNKEHRKYICDR